MRGDVLDFPGIPPEFLGKLGWLSVTLMTLMIASCFAGNPVICYSLTT